MSVSGKEFPVADIGSICSFSNGHGFLASDWRISGLPIIRIQNLNGSREFKYFSGQPDKNWIVNPGDLLFAWAGVKGVSFGPTIWTGPTGVLNQHIYRVQPCGVVDKRWLFYSLVWATVQIEKRAHGFKTNLVHVRKSDITRVRVPLPTISDQQKVARVLDNWSDAVEKLRELLTGKQMLRSGLTQRFLGIDGWDEIPLRDVVERVMRKNEQGNDNPLTISGRDGLINQSQFFDRRIAPELTDNYTLLLRGEFAYNKSYSNGYPYGAIKRLDSCDAGVVSSLYLCFRLKKDAKVLSDYLVAFCEAGGFNHQIHRIAQEGARNHGLLNVSAEDFFNMKMLVPPVDVQSRLAEFTRSSARELSLLREQLGQLNKQRRALLGQLFSLDARVGRNGTSEAH